MPALEGRISLRTVRRRSVAGVLTAAAMVLVTAGPSASAEPDLDHPADQPAAVATAELAQLRREAATDGSVAVLVAVGEDGADGRDGAGVIADELSGTDSTVRPVVDGLVAVDADPAGLERLATAEHVAALGPDQPLQLATTTASDGPTGAGSVHPLGINGAGRNVVVIDTGVDRSHPALSGALVAEACFVAGLGELCPNGRSTQVGAGAGAPCTVSVEGCGHGTHVAALAVGRPVGSNPAGVAPGAGLISIRIFGAAPGGTGEVSAMTSDLIAALAHVDVLRRTIPIDAVNLSISGGPLYGAACDAAAGGDIFLTQVAQQIDKLRRNGVAVVVATGNAGSAGQLAFPSCLSGVVPVAASTPDDAVATFSNRNTGVRLVAPGVDLVAAAPGGGTGVRSGTSMAAPQVSGAFALLRQRYAASDVSWLVQRLETTGRPIADPPTGATLRRIDLPAALGLAADSSGAGVPAAGAWVVTSRGRVVPLGQARGRGDRPTLARGERIVAGAGTPSGLGYWLATNRGRVVPYGDAVSFGDMAGRPLNAEVTAMAPTTGGKGYWLLAGDGGVFSFGDAQFRGSTGGLALNAPVTDLAATPSGQGYWLVATDGGVFSFGDADFHGSTGGMHLVAPVVSIAAGPRSGYWLVALDGGVFAFDVPFYGSLAGSTQSGGGQRLRVSALGGGYHILTSQGRAVPFGRAEPFARASLQAGERPVDLIVLP
jgi:subtilisin family serine protease